MKVGGEEHEQPESGALCPGALLSVVVCPGAGSKGRPQLDDDDDEAEDTKPLTSPGSPSGLVVAVSKARVVAGTLFVFFLVFFLLLHSAGPPRGLCPEAAVAWAGATRREKLHFPKTNRHLPQCVIIGVRKCGTRALLEMLNLHPQVQKASTEVHFFDRDENYKYGLEWYRKRMPYAFRDQITIEKSPSYFVTPEVPERIRAMNSSIKLLVIVREPVTRVVSDYTQIHSAKAAKGLHHQHLEQLVLNSDGSVNTQYKAVRISIYQRYFHKWLEVFPRDQIHVVNGDRLIQDPVFELRKIERFLGLETRISRDNFYFNKTKGFYCLRNETTEKCLNESKGRRHPDVDPKVVSKLRRFYTEHNQKFYELVGEDFGWPEQ